jgi:hypothetical protein
MEAHILLLIRLYHTTNHLTPHLPLSEQKWVKEFAFITSLLELLCIVIGSLVGNPLVE